MNRPSFVIGKIEISIAGTPVQLPSQQIPDGFALSIKAMQKNRGDIYIGQDQATAQNKVVPLAPGQGVILYVQNSDVVWINSDYDNDGIYYIGEV